MYIDNIELTVDDLSKKKVIVFLPVVKKIYAIIPVIVTLNKIIFLFFLNKFSKKKIICLITRPRNVLTRSKKAAPEERTIDIIYYREWRYDACAD